LVVVFVEGVPAKEFFDLFQFFQFFRRVRGEFRAVEEIDGGVRRPRGCPPLGVRHRSDFNALSLSALSYRVSPQKKREDRK